MHFKTSYINGIDCHEFDVYESALWSKKFYTPGSFEIVVPASSEVFSQFPLGGFIHKEDEKNPMFIEKIVLETTVQKGDRMIISGRSLEALLYNRIITRKMNYYDALVDNSIEALIKEHFIEPTNANRAINMTYIKSEDPNISELKSSGEFTETNCYSVVYGLCSVVGISYNINYIRSPGGYNLEFSLIKGTDHSYNQTGNPHVVFSPDFDNVLSSEMSDDITDYKNVAYVSYNGVIETPEFVPLYVGDVFEYGTVTEIFEDGRITVINDEGSEVLISKETLEAIKNKQYDNPFWIDEEEPTGIARKEIVFSNSNNTTGGALQDSVKESLYEYRVLNEFKGQIDGHQPFVYNVDFKVGDIIQFQNKYGYGYSARIIEYLWQDDDRGEKAYPIFEDNTGGEI